MALQIAAPHTWPAAILPSLIAMACAAANGYAVSAVMALVLLAICILMQAAVNTFNDYYDYVKGSDSAEDNVDPTDAVLVYNNVNPRSALMLAVGFLVVAFALGAYVIWQAGWVPLAIGIVGAIVVVLYSAGKTPISYLPIGELMSGFVMGGLIPLACYQAITKCFDPIMLVWALPTIIGVGLIMLTNNTCDVEKDIESGRKTLPVLLGRSRARFTTRSSGPGSRSSSSTCSSGSAADGLCSSSCWPRASRCSRPCSPIRSRLPRVSERWRRSAASTSRSEPSTRRPSSPAAP